MVSMRSFRATVQCCLFFVMLLIGVGTAAQEEPSDHSSPPPQDACAEGPSYVNGDCGSGASVEAYCTWADECGHVGGEQCRSERGCPSQEEPQVPAPEPDDNRVHVDCDEYHRRLEEHCREKDSGCFEREVNQLSAEVQWQCFHDDGGPPDEEPWEDEREDEEPWDEEPWHEIPHGCEEAAKAIFERCHDVMEEEAGRGECVRMAAKKLGGMECADDRRRSEERPGDPPPVEGPCFPFDVGSEDLIQRWIEQVAMEHDVRFTPEKVRALPRCSQTHFPPGSPSGPGPGGLGMGRSHDPSGERGVGEVFGRAVGMLVELSGQDGLPEEAKQKVREALEWFSNAIGDIAAGGEIGGYVLEAKEKLQSIMAFMGQGRGPGDPGGDPWGPGGHPPGGPDPERIAVEIGRNLDMMERMVTDMIPRALTMAEGMGHDVSSLYDDLERLRATLESIRGMCAVQDAGLGTLDQCFAAMEELGREMERMGRKAESIMPKGDMRRIEEEIGFDEEYRDPSSEGMSPNGGQYPMMMNGEESHRMPGMYDPNGVEQNDHLRMIRGGDFENNRRPDRMPPMHDGEPFPSDQFAPHPQGGFYPQPPYRERELGDWMQDFMSKCRSEGKSNEECKSATDENMRGERPDEYIPLMDPFEMCVREGMPLEYCEERRWEYEQ